MRQGLSGKSSVLLQCGLERRHKLAAQLLWALGLINETTAIALNEGYKSRHLRFAPLTSGEQIMILKKIVHFLLVFSFHYYYYSVTQFESQNYITCGCSALTSMSPSRTWQPTYNLYPATAI